jgi:hypothetical protein
MKRDTMVRTYSIVGIIINPCNILDRGKLGMDERIVCGLNSPGLV